MEYFQITQNINIRFEQVIYYADRYARDFASEHDEQKILLRI
jgi:hypothetical protein